MLSRKFPIFLVIVVLVGIVASVIYFQRRTPAPDAVPSASLASGQNSDLAGGQKTERNPEVMPSSATSPTYKTPDFTVDANGLSKATVVMKTTEGVIRFKFYPNDAPNTSKRIAELINQGFYNGLSFHRVVPGFVAQGGDPTGTGAGGSGTRLKAEFSDRKHVDGTVAMARAADPDSADSQFYIVLGTHSHLDHSYTVFGQLIEGIDVAHKLQVGSKMLSVVIE